MQPYQLQLSFGNSGGVEGGAKPPGFGRSCVGVCGIPPIRDETANGWGTRPPYQLQLQFGDSGGGEGGAKPPGLGRSCVGVCGIPPIRDETANGWGTRLALDLSAYS